ncbi:MAG: hypothetical protein IJ899_10140 [Blautia sp.]|nr:hypothetical protein [Blautia sp.]
MNFMKLVKKISIKKRSGLFLAAAVLFCESGVCAAENFSSGTGVEAAVKKAVTIDFTSGPVGIPEAMEAEVPYAEASVAEELPMEEILEEESLKARKLISVEAEEMFTSGTMDEAVTSITKALTVPVVVDETAEEEESFTSAFEWDGPVLNTMSGTVMGPSGKETYYNLDMSGVVSIMRSMGNEDPYWVREDGCKMLGDYIMCAANLQVHPRGSLVPCSLGMAIVCDTGGFADWNPEQLDIAVTW